MAILKMVWAEDNRHAIGKDGHLPWSLPADLAHFKEETLHTTMVMGRATWESIGRPLPKRHSVVLTSQTTFDPGYDDVTVLHSKDELVTLIHEEWAAGKVVTVAGGAQIYRLLMPLATDLSVTKVMGNFDGDTFVDPIDPDQFELVEQKKLVDHDQPIEFLTYERKA
ncbi:dihydrofolate reductase [Fructobacillus parabroussonetiae]|uniref:Dihydrofolate reductase n=1 Tax=Fructobacillus parabroussonetiae TaxID=2713174 RepID=A0ABS5QWA1_9LACO|nr:dihydrofolate reductase [Fructobacillus parabroussonetiae]MBS9337474.1 dihydrofolate reductase [Fructobacillus parabroussonetiae]MCK8617003.1 dihydrofolate reductase [Fructobacillus parabroussonetiae]